MPEKSHMPERGAFPTDENIRKKEGTGGMTVREAGHLGGEKVRDLIHKGEEEESRKGHKAA